MANRPWKQFEREAGALIGGTRFWANSGEAVDCEGPTCIAQAKHVKSLSLNALAELAETAEKQGMQKFKAGLVIVKPRRGKGRSSPTLVVMTAATWTQLHGPAEPRAADPIGSMLRAAAERIEAGEPWPAALADYGLTLEPAAGATSAAPASGR